MHPVFQTTFGGPDAPLHERGNCYSACIASILGLRIDQVPNFNVASEVDGVSFHDAAWAWLKRRGLWVCGLTWNQDWNLAAEQQGWGPYILSGQSPRGAWYHSVVGHSGRIWHDPRPDVEPPHLLPSGRAYPWQVEVLCLLVKLGLG